MVYIAISTSLVWAIQLGLIPRHIRTVEGTPKTDQSVTSVTHLGEASFAEQFAREYFVWKKNREEERDKRLAEFLPQNMIDRVKMDVKDATFEKAEVFMTSVWNVKTRTDGSDIKDVTVFVEQWLYSESGKDDKRVLRYLVVPVKKAGESYLVADQPYEIPRPQAAQLTEKKKDEKSEGQLVDEATSKKVETFLNDFWKSYTQDRKEQIAYMMKDQKPVQGYKGIFKFVQLSNLKIYKEQGIEYKADCDVLLEDVQSAIKVTYHYQFTLIQEKDRFYVSKMKQGEK